MPVGSELPHYTFTESGVQSVRTAINASDTETIVSTFLSQPPRKYLSGVSTVVLEESVTGTNANTNIGNLLSSVTFRLPDDCDAISDVFLTYTGDWSPATNTVLSRTLGYELIDKVEVRVGNYIWQTMTGADLVARNVTECKSTGLEEFLSSNCNLRSMDYNYGSTNGTITMVSTATNSGQIAGVVDLKLFCGSGDRLNSFVQAGAPNNYVTVKVFLNSITDDTGINKVASITNFKMNLVAKRHTITKLEKDFLNNNIVNSVINTSQNKAVELSGTYGSGDNTEFTVTVDLNDFNLNASHLLLMLYKKPYGTVKVTPTAATSSYFLSTEGAFTSSTVPGSFDGLKFAEFFANGNSVTGKLNASLLLKTTGNSIGLNSISKFPVYVIPFASYMFGEDCATLSKLNNKKLVLTFTKSSLGGSSFGNDLIANVTCVGTNVVTYVGGESNLQISN